MNSNYVNVWLLLRWMLPPRLPAHLSTPEHTWAKRKREREKKKESTKHRRKLVNAGAHSGRLVLLSCVAVLSWESLWIYSLSFSLFLSLFLSLTLSLFHSLLLAYFVFLTRFNFIFTFFYCIFFHLYFLFTLSLSGSYFRVFFYLEFFFYYLVF